MGRNNNNRRITPNSDWDDHLKNTGIELRIPRVKLNKYYQMKYCLKVVLFVLACLVCDAQEKDENQFILLGKVKPRNANEIKGSNWLLGCETLDRDFTDYDQYKEYLIPLGIKRLRLQAGWAKTEKVKGQYDWAWLDHIVNDAVSRGLEPWLQFSYGNPIYQGGGGINLAAGVPESDAALSAWDQWVEALVKRYKGKVNEYEIWNEPNFGDNLYNTPEKAAALHIQTIKIIKEYQPDAKVSGLALGHIDLNYADQFFKALYESSTLSLFNNMTYHDYVYNPDVHYNKVLQLKEILERYAPDIPLRQGENGAPSLNGFGRGALGNHDWTELSQAKWNTRRMLGDLGHDIESSVFSIIDMAYTSGPIKLLNVKGLLMSDSTKHVIKPKLAYHAVQHITSIFDHSLERIKNIKQTYNGNLVPENPNDIAMTKSTDLGFAVYGYRHKESKLNAYTIWKNESIPDNSTEKQNCHFTFTNANFNDPVYVDIITGEVFEIPDDKWMKAGPKYSFRDIPVYDGPILIADKSLVLIQ